MRSWNALDSLEISCVEEWVLATLRLPNDGLARPLQSAFLTDDLWSPHA
jgi:hypothetical protein